MNTEKQGVVFAKVVESKKSNKKKVFLSAERDREKVDDYLEEYNVKPGQTLQQVPSNLQRDVIYLCGKSGSGKSTYAMNYLKEYKRKYKDRNVYVFSFFEKDESLDNLSFIKRIPLDERFLKTDFQISDFSNSCILYDDVDLIKSKPIKEKLRGILNIILEGGRHVGTTLLYVSHICMKGYETRTIMNECGSIVIFPDHMNTNHLKNLLSIYFGMSKKQIVKIKNLESRHVVLIKNTSPNVVLHSKGAYVMRDDYFV